MSVLTEQFTQEFEMEATATGRLLERLPEAKLDWRPHPKSMSLGQLALHVATIPATVAAEVRTASTEVSDLIHHPEPASLRDIQGAWAGTLTAIRTQLPSDTDEGTWSAISNGKSLLTLPKTMARRALMLNHWYHHRGQLTVYLRLLDTALPSVYGPSADENPFASVE